MQGSKNDLITVGHVDFEAYFGPPAGDIQQVNHSR